MMAIIDDLPDKPYCPYCHATEGTAHAMDCKRPRFDAPTHLPRAPGVKQHVRVVLVGGHWFDMDPPANFDFVRLVESVRAIGYFMNGKVYIPGSAITTVFLWDDQNPPNMVNAPVPPGTTIQ